MFRGRMRLGALADDLTLGGMLSIAFLAVSAKAAFVSGALYLLFPELAALSYDVFTRPTGAWARAPVMLAITPVVTAVMGTALTRAMPYSLLSVALVIAGAMLVVRVMRSPVVPAISAAFLPLVFGVTSWWYPVSIAVVTGLLALASVLHGWLLGPMASGPVPARERAPQRRIWLPVFAGFLLLAYGLATVTGLRMLLFPPLVVIALEMFAHADIRPWAKRPLILPLVCAAAAGAGLAASAAFGGGPLSVVVSLLAGIAMLRVLRLHFPPALAIGLLPQVMPQADWRFVLAVILGTGTLTGVFLVARPHLLGRSA